VSAARALRALLLALAVTHLLAVPLLSARRVPYPFALEWCESHALQQVERLRAGEPLYAPPTLRYVAAAYGPIYYYAAAALAPLLPDGFLPLRLVSLGATLASCALLAAIAHRATRSRTAALLAAGFYAATFHASGGWMDVARVDALFLMFVLLGVFLLAATTSGPGALLAGLALALAFFTKQTAVVPLAVMAAALLAWDRRRLPWLAAGAGLPILAGGLLLDRLTQGWYGYFAFRPHPLIRWRFVSFWSFDMLRTVPLAGAFGLAALAIARRGRAADAEAARGRWLLAAFVAALIACGYAGRLVSGAVANALMPAFAGAALAFAVGGHDALEHVRGSRPRWEPALWAALLVQLALLSYDPRRALPTRADRAAGERLVRTIAATPGRLLVPHHPYLLTRAGKPAHAEYSTLFDVVSYGGGEPGRRLLQEARAALARGDYDAVFLDKAFMLEADLSRRYRPARVLSETEGAFVPVSGAPLKPESLWRRAEEVGTLPPPRSSSSVPPGSGAATP
jgi:hypothetical protein